MFKLFTIFIAALLLNSSVLAQPSPENIEKSVKENDLAQVAMMKKDSSTAYEHLKNAVELDPTNSTFINSAAYLAMQMKEFDQSLAYLDKALELDKETFGESHPNVASVLNNIASVYATKGDKQKSIEYYQKAYEMIVAEVGENHPQAEVIKGLLEREISK